MYILVVQPVCHVRLSVTPWTAARHPSLSSTISRSLLKFMFIESVMLTNHLILCHPFLLLPSIFSSIRVFFKWVDSLYQVAEVLELQSFQWIQGWFPLGLTGLIFLHSKGLSRVFFSTTIQKHQVFSAQPFLWSNSHSHTWLLEKQ